MQHGKSGRGTSTEVKKRRKVKRKRVGEVGGDGRGRVVGREHVL